MISFRKYWEHFYKRALSPSELQQVRRIIKEEEEKRTPSSKIIELLQSKIPELSEKYRAETAYWTESKKKETKIIVNSSSALDITKYKIVPSPGACENCMKVSERGDKVFTTDELEKDGRPIVPVHPNCYCVIIPFE